MAGGRGGAGGCSVHAAPELLTGGQGGAAGTAAFGLPIPAEPLIVGLEYFTQYWVFDAPANQAGITLTNGLATRVGGM